MARTARDEGFAGIADWFEALAKADRSLASRFQKSLGALADLMASFMLRRQRRRAVSGT